MSEDLEGIRKRQAEKGWRRDLPLLEKDEMMLEVLPHCGARAKAIGGGALIGIYYIPVRENGPLGIYKVVVPFSDLPNELVTLEDLARLGCDLELERAKFAAQECRCLRCGGP